MDISITLKNRTFSFSTHSNAEQETELGRGPIDRFVGTLTGISSLDAKEAAEGTYRQTYIPRAKLGDNVYSLNFTAGVDPALFDTLYGGSSEESPAEDEPYEPAQGTRVICSGTSAYGTNVEGCTGWVDSLSDARSNLYKIHLDAPADGAQVVHVPASQLRPEPEPVDDDLQERAQPTIQDFKVALEGEIRKLAEEADVPAELLLPIPNYAADTLLVEIVAEARFEEWRKRLTYEERKYQPAWGWRDVSIKDAWRQTTREILEGKKYWEENEDG